MHEIIPQSAILRQPDRHGFILHLFLLSPFSLIMLYFPFFTSYKSELVGDQKRIYKKSSSSGEISPVHFGKFWKIFPRKSPPLIRYQKIRIVFLKISTGCGKMHHKKWVLESRIVSPNTLEGAINSANGKEKCILIIKSIIYILVLVS